MKKILCISHSSEIAGAEKAFVELVRALGSKGYTVSCIFPCNGPLVELCKPFIDTFGIVKMPSWFGGEHTLYRKGWLLIRILISSYKIRNYVRRGQYDKVIVNTLAIPSAAIGSALAGNNPFWFMHETGNDGFSMIFGEKISKWLIGRISHTVICNSEFTCNHYSSFINAKKLRIAYQAVEITLPDQKSGDGLLTFGLVGRISEQKGQAIALSALGSLMKRESNVRLLLAGSDRNDLSVELKNRAVQNKMKERVLFKGQVDNIGEIYSAMDVLIACGKNESFGRSTVEAMKFGLPVIVPDAFGYSELVRDGYNGLVYKSGDAEDLALKMERMFDPELRKKLGESGKQYANGNFTISRFADDLQRIIEGE